MWREIWKWSCLPSLLYCISRKTVDTEYTYYSWCMTSTDIVKWRKTNDYENFEKGMIYMKILKKRGGGGNEIHAPCACEQLIQAYHRYGVGFAPGFVNCKKGALDSQLQVISLPVACPWSVVLCSTTASSSTNTGRHDIAEILLKVALNTKNKKINLFL